MNLHWSTLALTGLFLLGSAGAYTVHRGDTLSLIAQRNGVTVSQLMRANGLRSTTLRVGQSLTIPSGRWTARQIPALPQRTNRSVYQRGYAVYYGGRWDPHTRMTAAHPSLPFGTWVKVTHQQTGRSITVKINDRGPFNGGGRIIDLSTTAARSLGILSQGVAPVTITILSRP